ncbi:unnamed protein product [Litomosoides sigmodontis]|uniref:FERM domain-containing protein n=1 Tax=Litomosoides sigmodontis TaxID=42156 RepID=A0A3P6SPE6_LITSI|nr:unnamed protein product [Litomosoides sigmodontis]
MIPKGVGAPPPPGMDNRRGKLMCIKVRMLDDSVGVFHLGHKALGQALFDEVCRHLNLLECDYFSLEFTDCYGNRCWLEKDKPILRQITATHSDARFYFIVKFYTPNPADIRDLAMGDLLCNENTAALLASYIVQSDCGDFAAEDYPDDSYLSSARFIPNQSVEFQRKVMQNHMKLIGMTPGESDLTLLETARRCDYYGVKLHSAKDMEGTEVSLTIAHMGIRVFHQFQCVSTFSWARIRKLSFKRRKLLIKLHSESHQYYKETIEFLFESRNECKNFWKKCVEHHTFFRCVEVLPVKKAREGRFFSKGSAFRYQGRTQKQLIDYIREHRKRREPFTRPIRSGLSSSSTARLSRPALLDMNYPAYATVSERSVNLIGSGTLPSRDVPVYCMNGESSMNPGPYISSQSRGQQLMPTGTMSYFPGEMTTSALNHRHRNSQHYPNNSSTAAVNGERMCLSDIESNDVCSLAGGSIMNLRHRQKHSDFKPRKQSNVKPVKAGAVAATSDTDNIGDTSDNDVITSASLPNVLGDDAQIACRDLELKCECPPKSASGDNFLELHQPPHDYDNVSEGSYKLSDNELRSTHSDVQPVAMNPVYATTFTAKRVGNVIVKKVRPNTRSTPNTTDDEDPYAERRLDGSRRKMETERNQREISGQVYQRESSENNHVKQQRFYTERKQPSSAPPSYAEYPLHQKLVPIEIDGPNVNLDEHMKLSCKREPSIMSKVRDTPPQAPIRTPTTKDESDVSRRCASITKDEPVTAIGPQSSDSCTKEVQPAYSRIVYTSKGTIVQKPKIIPDDDVKNTSNNIYSNVSLTHTLDSGQSDDTLISQPQQAPKTYGAIGPLPGKVITKENLVITPEGYRERKPKPVVPPKPKNLACASEIGVAESTSAPDVPGAKPSHPIVNLQKEETALFSTAPSSTRELNRPTLISVQSEDCPEIQKCHLFNSDIPYVLTMRNISAEAEGSISTFKDTSSKNTISEALANTIEKGCLHRSLPGSCSPDSLRRRKSLDLVPKKRLPSPCNFSSQDHSLSPSTPESGDVLEYLLRRRSVEKSAIARRGRRGDPRRQTQPVRFSIPESENEREQISAVSQPNLNDNDEEVMCIIENDQRRERMTKRLRNVDSHFKSEMEQPLETETENSRNDRIAAVIGNELMDSTNVDDFPPPPPPPPLPPLLPVALKQSVAPQPIAEGNMEETVEALPYVDESTSSRASCASKDEITDKVLSAQSLTHTIILSGIVLVVAFAATAAAAAAATVVVVVVVVVVIAVVAVVIIITLLTMISSRISLTFGINRWICSIETFNFNWKFAFRFLCFVVKLLLLYGMFPTFYHLILYSSTQAASNGRTFNDSECECSQIHPSKAARRSINYSSSMEQEQATGSVIVSDSKPINAALLIELSDSGEVTVSDCDSKPSRIGDAGSNCPFARTISLDVHQSLLESCSSQDFGCIFLSKEMNPKCFDVLKDIVMLERTAVFDLKILAEDLYELIPKAALSCGRALIDLFVNLKSLQQFHDHHLSTLELIVENWSECLRRASTERPRVGDLLLWSAHSALQYYRKFVQNSPIYLAAIDELTRVDSTFANSLMKLQMRNSYSCSINFLMLKVVHRMVVWQSLFGRMIAALLEESSEAKIASQLRNCRVAVEKVALFNAERKSALEGLVHFAKFVELRNDLNIVDGLTDPNRRFIRQGWLRKWTKRGFVPHAVILFNDALLLAYRSQADGFIRNAFIPLRTMTVEEGATLHAVIDPTNCLTIKAVSRTFLLCGDCMRVRDLWLEELTNAIRNAKQSKIEELPQTETFVITEGSLNDKLTHSNDMCDSYESTSLSDIKSTATLPYSTLNVCWYRHATLGIDAIITEREAVAVLPIINYHISLPQLSDKIDCDNVFKMSYNTHCYFFRTDSLYAFSKWYECIRQSTINSSPIDLIAGLPLK